MLNNDRIPSLETREHHYVDEFPNDTHENKKQKTIESMEVPSFIGAKVFSNDLDYWFKNLKLLNRKYISFNNSLKISILLYMFFELNFFKFQIN